MTDRTPPSEETVTDAQLVAVSRAGDIEGFQELVFRYQRRLYGLCYRLLGNHHDAEDACQDAFLKAYRSLHRYDPDRPLDRWLLTITANCCVSMLRRRRKHGGVSDRDAVGGPRGDDGSAASAADEAQAQELARAVGRAVDGLPDRYRLPFVLFHQENMPYEEIARALERPLGTVKSRVHRAREQLYQTLIRAGFLEAEEQS